MLKIIFPNPPKKTPRQLSDLECGDFFRLYTKQKGDVYIKTLHKTVFITVFNMITRQEEQMHSEVETIQYNAELYLTETLR